MSFLSPFALALALAAIVPLLLHLRRRRVARTVEFPAARYLARATRDHERTLRARSSLLAVLRILLVLLLALAAARPLARFGAGHGRAALALVVDNSMSSGAVVAGRSTLDDAKAAARAVLDASGAEDRLWLVTADGSVVAGDAATLRGALDALRPLAGAGDLSAALRAAGSLARGVRDAAPAVVVLTDGQATTWNAASGEADAVWAPGVAPPANHAILAADPRPARWSGRGAVHIGMLGAEGGDTLPVRVDLGGRTVARGNVVTAASGLGETEIVVAGAPAGWSPVRVALPPDELPADDERWTVAWSGTPPRVTSAAGPFAARAIDALVAAGVVSSGGDVSVTSADALGALPALVVAPLDPARVGVANRALERAGIPWRFGAERRGVARARGEGLGDVDVAARFALASSSAAPAETLATVGAEPWIVAGDRYVLVASALDTAATTFPASAGFVPWLARAITERLSPLGGASTTAVPGARVAVPARVDSVETPDGSRAGVRDTLVLPQRTGVYFWMRGGARVGAVVVNAEAEESRLLRMDDEGLRRRLGAPARVAHDGRSLAGTAFGRAARRPLGSLLLVLALALLVAEAVVAGRFSGAIGGLSSRTAG
ncbi:MAG TPA: VWA domain-containing protein [Gemmatimonadaceae bacterium]